jgi:hypothetical protein
MEIMRKLSLCEPPNPSLRCCRNTLPNIAGQHGKNSRTWLAFDDSSAILMNQTNTEQGRSVAGVEFSREWAGDRIKCDPPGCPARISHENECL